MWMRSPTQDHYTHCVCFSSSSRFPPVLPSVATVRRPEENRRAGEKRVHYCPFVLSTKVPGPSFHDLTAFVVATEGQRLRCFGANVPGGILRRHGDGDVLVRPQSAVGGMPT
jgi:hypothetical protein